MRLTAGIVGLILVVAAVFLGASAAWIRGTFAFVPDQPPWWDSAGQVHFDTGTVTSAASAIVIDVARLSATVPFVQDRGYTGLSVAYDQANATTGTPQQEIFLGSAPTQAVDDYLMGSAYDVALRTDGTWRVQPVPGVRAAAAPAAVKWTAHDTGTAPIIAMAEGDPVTVVAMHSGTDRPAMRVDVVFVWPEAGSTMVTLAIGSLACALIGGVLVGWTLGGPARGRHRRHRADDAAVHEPAFAEPAVTEPAVTEPAVNEAKA